MAEKKKSEKDLLKCIKEGTSSSDCIQTLISDYGWEYTTESINGDRSYDYVEFYPGGEEGGVYISDVITKSSQYSTDEGMLPGRKGIGSKGYLFLNHALIGDVEKHHRSAGLDSSDQIRSPEWAVFYPNEQLRIYKAYEIQTIHKDEMDEMKKKLSINEGKILKIKAFKEFLSESVKTSSFRSTFIFAEGLIPINSEEVVLYDEVGDRFFNDKVRLNFTPYGAAVEIDHDDGEDEVFFIQYIGQILRDKPALNHFLELVGRAV
jgi:hypothetical protein